MIRSAKVSSFHENVKKAELLEPREATHLGGMQLPIIQGDFIAAFLFSD
jgi:hypothetical protein